MGEEIRKTETDIINRFSWGTHICLFYQTKKDLIDILVPYFKAGLEDNEFCMWITSDPLNEREAKEAISKTVPDIEQYIKRGQIEVIPYDKWYLQGGSFNLQRMLNAWVEKLNQALAQGYDGLRGTGNTAWLEKKSWRNFVDYEAAVNNVISKYRMIDICTYSLDKCGAPEVIDVVNNHQFALIKRKGKWELIESSEHKQKEKALSETSAKLKTLQQVSEAVHSSLDLKKIFNKITDSAVHSMGYTTSFIAKLDKEKKCFKIKAFSTKKRLLSQIDKILGFSLKNFSFPADPELNASFKSGMEGKIVMAKTLEEMAYPLISKKKCSALQRLRKTKNFIIVPLKVRNEVVGVVVITSSKEKVSEEELKMLKSYANAASNAIYNANLHEQTKKAEKALQIEKAYLEQLFESAQEAIVTADNNGRVLHINREFTRLFGYTDDELIGQSIDKLLAPKKFLKQALSITKCSLEGKNAALETLRQHKDGTIINVSVLASPIRVGNQQVGVYAIYRDITDRKQAEEELKNSEERLRILFEYAPDAYYLNDLKGRFVDGNKAAEELTGYKKEELIGKSFLKLNLLTPKQIPKAAALLAKSALGQPTGPDEFILNRKGGNQVPMELRTFSVKIKDKTMVLGIARDITERKKAEDELRKSEMIYRALFEHANDAVFLINFKGLHIAINKKAADMLGYSIDELVGKSFKDIVASREYQNARQKLKDLIAGKTFPLYERTFRKKDGTEFPVEINVALVRDQENKPLFIQSIVRDITKRKKAEEQIKASLKEKDVLLQEIHHRVKNNMQIISSLIKLQSRHIKDEHDLELIKSTKNRVKSMTLIHERLYQSKDFARVDFSEYVQSLTSYLFSLYGISPNVIKLNMDIKDVLLDINTAIPCGLIVNELVSNALKHAFPNDKKGEINITLQPLSGNEIELIVSDNGIGIPEEIDIRNTESLGLHLVSILAEDQLYGDIKLDRCKGTHFYLRLKVKK